MLNWNKFSENFHESWHIKMQKFIESDECAEIYETLRNEKEKIYPLSTNTWAAFKNVNLNNIKALIIAQSPYHTTYKGEIIADGLALSCGRTRHETPSLKLFYDGMEDDLEIRVDREPDLTYLTMQDVMLLNTSLTVRADRGDSHMELWQPLMKYLFTQVFDTLTGVPIILIGETARKSVEPYLFPMSQPYKVVKHPAYYSRLQQPWKHEGMFNWANKIIGENTGQTIWWNNKDWEEKGLPF